MHDTRYWHGNTLKLGSDSDVLVQLLPIDGDHKMLKTYIIDKSGRPENMMLIEQFIYAMDNVARPQQKLAALLFLDSFQVEISHHIERGNAQQSTETLMQPKAVAKSSSIPT